MAFADAISMTTGPKSSCELPLTNRDPNNFTEAFSLPKKLYSCAFACFKQLVGNTERELPRKTTAKCVNNLTELTEAYRDEEIHPRYQVY